MKQMIGVIGGGAWGTALAQVMALDGKNVLLWARESDVVASINVNHENPHYLPKIKLHDGLVATDKIEDVAILDYVLLVTPAQHVRSTLENIKEMLGPDTVIILCSKGIELDSGMLLSQVAKFILPDHRVAIMTGPTFARELASGMPSAVTIASPDEKLGAELQDVLGAKTLRPYTTADMIGAELGGAIKNVLAIACGIVTGRKMGESARAALLTRGVAEIARLAVAMGAKKQTLLGMCGVGDLVLTCTSMQSRNFSLGVALGEGKTLDEILGPRKAVTEGVHTAKAALDLAKKNAVDMPITEAVKKCLHDGMSIDDAIGEMLNRPFKYDMKGREKGKK